MANYVSGYSGEQLEAVLDLFVNKGLGSVNGFVKRKSDGTFETGSASTGTVTSVGVANGGGLSVTGSPITTSGTITIGHSNSVTAQSTQAVYPIKIDGQGHISAYGSAVSVPTSAANHTTGVTVSDHSTTTIYGVQSSTTTASKASGANGSAPSLTYAIDGSDSHQLNISWSAGSASTWSFSDVTVPIKNGSKTTVVTSKTHTVNDSGHTHTLS